MLTDNTYDERNGTCYYRLSAGCGKGFYVNVLSGFLEKGFQVNEKKSHKAFGLNWYELPSPKGGWLYLSEEDDCYMPVWEN